MHEKLTRGLQLGFIGNLLFIIFGLICAVYYATFDGESIHSQVLEAVAYFTECMGFVLLVIADVLMITSMRARKIMKILFSLYIALEVTMMILELNFGGWEFYRPYSLALAIVHSVVSAAVCFSFLQLDAKKTKLELAVIICVAIILFGMFGNIMGIRVYFSIAFNAVSFSVLFFMILRLLKIEEIEIDCFGDKEREQGFKSTFFD